MIATTDRTMLIDDINTLSAIIGTHVFTVLPESARCAIEDKKAELCAKLMVPYIEVLNRNKAPHGIAPHKAVMILTVMRMVEEGTINGTVLMRSDRNMRETFKQVWAEYVPKNTRFRCEWENPYKHLNYEGFWCLQHDGKSVRINSLLIYAMSREAGRTVLREVLLEMIDRDTVKKHFDSDNDSASLLAAENLTSWAAALPLIGCLWGA